jgi:hypothetical protein
LKQRHADLLKRLTRFGQLHPNTIALKNRQSRPLKSLSTRFGIPQNESDQRAIRGIVDRKTDDPIARYLKPTNHFEQLTDPILQKDRKLPERRKISTPHGLVCRY